MTAAPHCRVGSPPVRQQLLRFLVVGCLNVGVTFVVFVLCYRWLPVGGIIVDLSGGSDGPPARAMAALGAGSIDAAAANGIGYAAGMANSFVLNKLWTFQAAGQTARQLGRFVALNLVSLAVSTAVMFVAVDALAAPYLPVFIATVALTTAFHFVANKHWTFADARDAATLAAGRRLS